MAAKRRGLSVIILTRDEEKNIAYTLESVKDLATEIIIVDSFSTDHTLEICSRYTDRIYQHAFINQAEQFNWALDNVPIVGEWILRLDADEFVLPELRDEIITLLPKLPAAVTGLFMKRRVYFWSRWIRHGGYYPTWLLRLFRTGRGRCEEIEMDEHILVNGETRRLSHDFVDYNRKDLKFWTIKHEAFAAREARTLLQKGSTGVLQRLPGNLRADQRAQRRWMKMHLYARLPLFLRAFLYFIYRYVFRLGFLDGTEGLVFHFLQGCWYRFYVDAKIYEARKMRIDHGEPDLECSGRKPWEPLPRKERGA